MFFETDGSPSLIDLYGFITVFYKSLRFFWLNSSLLILISGKMLEIPNTLDVGFYLSLKSDLGQVYVYFRHFWNKIGSVVSTLSISFPLVLSYLSLLKLCWVSSSKIELHSGLIFLNNNKYPQYRTKNAWSRHILDLARIWNSGKTLHLKNCQNEF